MDKEVIIFILLKVNSKNNKDYFYFLKFSSIILSQIKEFIFVLYFLTGLIK